MAFFTVVSKQKSEFQTYKVRSQDILYVQGVGTMDQKFILKGCEMADLRELKIWCVHLTDILVWMSFLPKKLPASASHYAFWAP